MRRTLISATLVALITHAAVALAEERPPAADLGSFMGPPGSTFVCKPMTPKERRAQSKCTLMHSELPKGCKLSDESTIIGEGVLGTRVSNRPNLWAADYTWFWVIGGPVQKGIYTLDQLMHVADSLALPDSANLDLNFVVVRRGLQAASKDEATERAKQSWPTEFPASLRQRIEERRIQDDRRAAKKAARSAG